MKPTQRPHRTEEDYWCIREFLREVSLHNNRRDFSWSLLRWDYWRWHVNENIFQMKLEDVVTLWDMKGLGFVRGDFVRDVASLNKMELLPWDCWGVILNEQMDDPNDLAVLDEVAALTAGDVPDFDTLRARYDTDSRFRVDGSFMSFINGEMVEVKVA